MRSSLLSTAVHVARPLPLSLSQRTQCSLDSSPSIKSCDEHSLVFEAKATKTFSSILRKHTQKRPSLKVHTLSCETTFRFVSTKQAE